MMLEDVLNTAVNSHRCMLDEEARHSKGAFTPFLTLAELIDGLSFSLITSDYLTVFRSGALTSLRGLTMSRQVLNKHLDGFVDPVAVRALYSKGNTLQFKYIDHWKPAAANFLANHVRFPAAEILASAFAVPPHARPMDAHTEGAHLFILQMDGLQDVLMGDPGDKATVPPAYLPFDGMPTRNFTLQPGDILHVPHGWPYCEETAEEASLHLAITVKRLGTEQIATTLSSLLLEGIESSPAFTSHHRISPPDKSQQVISILSGLLANIDPDEIVRRTEVR